MTASRDELMRDVRDVVEAFVGDHGWIAAGHQFTAPLEDLEDAEVALSVYRTMCRARTALADLEYDLELWLDELGPSVCLCPEDGIEPDCRVHGPHNTAGCAR